ncbi:MAG TPA: AIR synthase related protein, partial [Candidatus Glassbacteria bacterium]|nr:AIR synthase related protein [Candidatus Glassbacteria bacterium]
LLRLKETGQGLAMSLDGNGRWCWLDPRRGARLAVAEAARNVSVTGAQPLGATNCLNFGNPEKPTVMWQFREVIEGISEACEALSIPITGGNVSFYNETDGRPIYPTPVIGVVGLLAKAERHATVPFKNSDRAILLLSGPAAANSGKDFPITFGSSQSALSILGSVWGLPPQVDLAYECRVQACCRRWIAEGLVESAHDISDGGLAVALAECCIGAGIGAALDMPAAADPLRWLFAEDPSRILVTVGQNQVAEALRLAAEYNLVVETIGSTGGDNFTVSLSELTVLEVSVSDLRLSYETALEQAVEKVAEVS